MIDAIESFFELVGKHGAEMIYNEFSLQHELGVYLRSKCVTSKVQFERNVSYFGLTKAEFEKKEIDISIFTDPEDGLECVVELKYPRNGQIPETMYSFCKDIAFLEQLVAAGFKKGYFIAVAEDPLFYSGRPNGIYGMFRAGLPITGEIKKPTGARDTSVKIRGNYTARWNSVDDNMKYCLLEVSG